MREEKQKKIISALLLEKDKVGSTIAGLEEEVTLLKSKLDNLTKYICMLNNDSDMLDEILEIVEKKTIEFDYSSMNKNVKFPTKKIGFQMLDHMSQHRARHVYPQHRGIKNSIKRCHHCGRCGHIRLFCYNLYGSPQYYSHPKSKKRKRRKLKLRKCRNSRNLSNVS